MRLLEADRGGIIMLLIIEDLLSPDEAERLRGRLDAASWIDGRATAGSISSDVKHNQQLDENDILAIELGNQILRLLGNHPLFVSAALPQKIYPPKFNRYRDGGNYGLHVDSAVMHVPGGGVTLRSDISATLFLSHPDEYDGGELVIEDSFGAQPVKLPAGHMVLYPSGSLHQVMPVTRGERVAAFFWTQSMVADDAARTLLFDLDQSIQSLSLEHTSSHPDLMRLTGIYHNLLRRWAQV